MTKKSNTYPPDIRSNYCPQSEDLVSSAPDGSETPLADTTTDPVVVNNICCPEFDYTDEPILDND